MGLFGLFLSYIFYILAPSLPGIFVKAFKWIHTLLFNKWFFDEIYNRVFVQNAVRLGKFFWVRGDQKTIDRFGPDGSAKLSLKTGRMFGWFQSGMIYQYAFVMMIGVVMIVTWYVYKFGHWF